MAYNKYYLQKKQVSYDNGLTWEDVTPSETRQGAYIDSYETLGECEAIDYSTQYLTFVAETDNMSVSLSYANSNVYQYSVDGGQTWSNLANSGSTTSVNSGETIMFKASGLTVSSSDGIGTLNPSVSASVQGNIMSLVYGDDFVGQTTISDYQFKYLFSSCLHIISIENLILPATTLANNCYEHMFSYLSRITTAPELPAATLTDYCYRYMFYRCTSLNYIKCLATDISATNCTNYWVSNVASTGTFVKDANTTWTTGNSGIPSGWTVQNNS